MTTYPQPKAAAGVSAEPRISFPRWWIEHVRDGLMAMDKLPSGPLGDWAFLFREMLTDALEEPTEPSRTLPSSDQCVAREALEKIRDFPYVGEKAAQQMALIAGAALSVSEQCAARETTPEGATHMRRPEYLTAWQFDRKSTMPLWLIERFQSRPLPDDRIGHYATAVDGEFWRWFDPEKFNELFRALAVPQAAVADATPSDARAVGREEIARCLVNNDPNYFCNHMPGDDPREVTYSSGWRGKSGALSDEAAERVRVRADAILALANPAPTELEGK